MQVTNVSKNTVELTDWFVGGNYRFSIGIALLIFLVGIVLIREPLRSTMRKEFFLVSASNHSQDQKYKDLVKKISKIESERQFAFSKSHQNLVVDLTRQLSQLKNKETIVQSQRRLPSSKNNQALDYFVELWWLPFSVPIFLIFLILFSGKVKVVLDNSKNIFSIRREILGFGFKLFECSLNEIHKVWLDDHGATWRIGFETKNGKLIFPRRSANNYYSKKDIQLAIRQMERFFAS